MRGRRRTTGAGTVALVVALVMGAAACGSTEDPVSEGPGQPDGFVSSSTTAAGGSSTTGAGGQGGGGSSTTAAPPAAEGDEDSPEIEVSTQLPEGWPDDLPIPEDAVLEFSQRTEGTGGLVLTADFTVQNGGANVYTAMLDDLEEQGATILQRSSGSTDAGYVGSLSFETGDYTGNVAVDAFGGVTTLTVSVLPS